MATLTADQRRRRRRIETLIRLAAPALNVVLAAGERLSRAIEPTDTEYYPPRTQGLAPPLPRPAAEPAADQD